MRIILDFAVSPEADGSCTMPPRFYSINAHDVRDGHVEYASAITIACEAAAKKAILETAKLKRYLKDAEQSR